MRKNKKNKPRLTNEAEFLQFTPRRLDFPWETTDDGIVHVTVPKFTSNIGKSFCKLLKKENTFVANFDKIGSLVWRHCDGKNTVQQILDIVKQEFPDGKDIDQRLFLFLLQMNALHYLML
ncbi:MAG: PqqD family peptide modification chaperone [Euryarchaeota archaeon]|nr:PqqD family peptide modification chaperone [Euryarchaeota archaeon]